MQEILESYIVVCKFLISFAVLDQPRVRALVNNMARLKKRSANDSLSEHVAHYQDDSISEQVAKRIW